MISPPPPGQSIGASILEAIPVIGAFFQGYTTGLLARALSDLKELRDALIRLADDIARAIHRVAGWVDKAMHGLAWLWRNVIRPMLKHIQKLFDRLNRLIDKVLKPYLDFMDNVRRQIMLIYNTYFRPIIQLIESMRRALAILRLAHIHLADQLDQKLARLEAKISKPVLDALRRTSVAGRWMNVLLTARMILQQPIFCNSAYAYQGTLQRHLINSFTPPADDARAARLEAGPPVRTTQEMVSNINSAVLYQSGDLAIEVQQMIQRILTGQPPPSLP